MQCGKSYHNKKYIYSKTLQSFFLSFQEYLIANAQLHSSVTLFYTSINTNLQYQIGIYNTKKVDLHQYGLN